jgi:hypothetical protein
MIAPVAKNKRKAAKIRPGSKGYSAVDSSMIDPQPAAYINKKY